MINLKLRAAKIIGALGIVALLCCVGSTAGRAQAGGGPQQTAKEFHCPNTSLSALAAVKAETVNSIDTLRLGIGGLPCDGGGETNPPKDEESAVKFQNGFDYYSWMTFIALNSPPDGTPIGMDA